MIRPECEQHYTPSRDNQYRATARYYKDSCPYCEIDRLKGELEEANKHKSDWHNMYQETYDELSSVQQAILVETVRIKTAWREIATLEQQLAEARTDAEEAKFAYKVARDDATQARQEAARTIERYLLGMFWCIPSKENEPMIYRDQAIEWLRVCFKLEG